MDNLYLRFQKDLQTGKFPVRTHKSAKLGDRSVNSDPNLLDLPWNIENDDRNAENYLRSADNSISYSPKVLIDPNAPPAPNLEQFAADIISGQRIPANLIAFISFLDT